VTAKAPSQGFFLVAAILFAVKFTADAQTHQVTVSNEFADTVLFRDPSMTLHTVYEPSSVNLKVLTSADIDQDNDNDLVAGWGNSIDITWIENDGGAGTNWIVHELASPLFYEIQALSVADLDDDEDLDIVGGGRGNASMVWFENLAGDGTTWDSHLIATGFHEPRSIATADMDCDGDIDIVGAAGGTYNVRWWENVAGNGTTWVEHGIDKFITSVDMTVFDIDADSDPDVFAFAEHHGSLVWWENEDGQGRSWSKFFIDPVVDRPQDIQVCDMDGDGDGDVLGGQSGSRSIAWWENLDGTGTSWAVHAVTSDFGNVISVFGADLDGDKDMDVLGSALSRKAMWWENLDGGGREWGSHELAGGRNLVFALSGDDLNGDGTNDVLAGWNSSRVLWWDNHVDIQAHFGPGLSMKQVLQGSNLIAGTDSIVEINDYTQQVCTGWTVTGGAPLLGNGSRTVSFPITNDTTITFHWKTQVLLETGISGPGSVDPAAGWVDGGTSVVLTASANHGASQFAGWTGDVPAAQSNDNPLVLLMDAHRSVTALFTAPVWNVTVTNLFSSSFVQADPMLEKLRVVGGLDFTASLRHGDVDEDGDLDLIGGIGVGFGLAPSSSMVWYENLTGNAMQWIPHGVENVGPRVSAFAADVDKDGDKDIIAAERRWNTIAWWENRDGKGKKWAYRYIADSLVANFGMHAADFDTDGDVDIVVSDGSTLQVSLLENDGVGSNWNEHVIGDFTNFAYLGAGDVNSDSHLDLVITVPFEDGLWWWENVDGKATNWVERLVSNSILTPRGTTVGDIDGDGDMDIAAGSSGGNSIEWFENIDEDLGIWKRNLVDTNFTAYSLQIADLDGDGDGDVVANDFGLDAVAWWENANQVGTQWRKHSIANNVITFEVHTADLDDDNDEDLLWAEFNGTSFWWWRNRLESRVVLEPPLSTMSVPAGINLAAISADPAVGNNFTQWACIGWSRSGSDPGTGVTCNTGPFALTNEAIVAFEWETQYRVDTTAIGPGNMIPGDPWIPSGSVQVITGTPHPYAQFLSFSGDTNSAAISSNEITVTMGGFREVQGRFLADSTADGIPHWWLAQHGWTNDFDDALGLDTDADQLTTGQEWEAGTNPTNAASVVRILEMSSTAGGGVSLRFSSTPGRTYFLFSSAAVESGEWLPVPGFPAAGVVATGSTTTVHFESTSNRRYYRLGVKNLLRIMDLQPAPGETMAITFNAVPWDVYGVTAAPDPPGQVWMKQARTLHPDLPFSEIPVTPTSSVTTVIVESIEWDRVFRIEKE